MRRSGAPLMRMLQPRGLQDTRPSYTSYSKNAGKPKTSNGNNNKNMKTKGQRRVDTDVRIVGDDAIDCV